MGCITPVEYCTFSPSFLFRFPVFIGWLNNTVFKTHLAICSKFLTCTCTWKRKWDSIREILPMLTIGYHLLHIIQPVHVITVWILKILPHVQAIWLDIHVQYYPNNILWPSLWGYCRHCFSTVTNTHNEVHSTGWAFNLKYTYTAHHFSSYFL